MPKNAANIADNQVKIVEKTVYRKIVEIKVFYDDGTYETFKQTKD